MMERGTWGILALAVLAAAAGGWLQHASRLAHVPAGVTVVEIGDRLPDLVLPDLDGRPHHLSDYAGHRVLLNFWASWCAPCIAEMPALAKAQAKFGEHGAIVVGIAMDDPRRARAFLAAHPVSYPILLGRLESPSTSLQLGDRAELLPYSVLLDDAGRILARQRGPLTPPQLERWLAPAAGAR